MRYGEILDAAGERILRSSSLSVSLDDYGGELTVKSRLHYAYRPVFKYRVRISRDGAGYRGRISVTVRSGEVNVLRSFAGFLDTWKALEHRHFITGIRFDTCAYAGEPAFFSRGLYLSLNGPQTDERSIGADPVEEGYLAYLRGGKLTV